MKSNGRERLADYHRRVLKRRISDTRLSEHSFFSYERDRFWDVKDADSAKAVGTDCIRKHFFFFFSVLPRVGKQLDPPCKFNSLIR